MTTSGGARRTRGFTLLEVMLAFVLLAGAMGLLIGMLSGGLRLVGEGRSQTEAAMYAQSLLDELGVLAPLRAGRTTGEFGDGRYAYALDIAPTADPAPASAPPVPGAPAALPPQFGDRRPVLYRVQLRVRWGGGAPGQQLEITTLRYRVPPSDEDARG